MNDKSHIPASLKFPKPDRVETYEKMNSLDRVFHEQVLRHAKGIINLYEKWIETRNR